MRIFLFYILLMTSLFSAQNVGVNTAYPKTLLHIDANKDNVVTPTESQLLSDFVVTKDGNIMVGGIGPTSKFEIKTGVANTSGLRFRNLTSSSPVTVLPANSAITFLGVDNMGNVIISGRDEDRLVTTIENNITNYKGAVRNNDGSANTALRSFEFVKLNGTPVPFLPSTIVPGSEVEFTIPAGKPRAVFMNFMMSFGLTFTGDASTNGSEVFGAEIVIDKINTSSTVTTETGVSQITQLPSRMPTRQMYAVNYVTNLGEGKYVAKIKIITKRFLFSSATTSTEKTVKFDPIQFSYNISFFES